MKSWSHMWQAKQKWTPWRKPVKSWRRDGWLNMSAMMVGGEVKEKRSLNWWPMMMRLHRRWGPYIWPPVMAIIAIMLKRSWQLTRWYITFANVRRRDADTSLLVVTRERSSIWHGGEWSTPAGFCLRGGLKMLQWLALGTWSGSMCLTL